MNNFFLPFVTYPKEAPLVTLTALRAELQPGRFDTCYPKALRLILVLPPPDYKAGLLPRSLMSQTAQIPDVLSGHSPDWACY